MAKFRAFSEGAARRVVNATRQVERAGGVHVPVPTRTSYGNEYPIPTHIGKASGTIAAGGSGSATLWGTTSLAGSTVAETSIGSSVTVHSWSAAAADSGDELIIWRHVRSGRLYFLNMTRDLGSAITVSSDIAGYSTAYSFPIITQTSSGGMTWIDLNSSLVTGYSTGVAKQALFRSSTGVFWESPSTCA